MDSDLFKKSVKIRDLKFEICEIIVSNLLDKVTWWHFQSTLKEIICPKFFFELHASVKKCHFGNFSERAGMAVPC